MTKNSAQKTRLMVAASESDADMLFATKFFAPDPFIFLEQNGKRTLVLSDLEIDRGRKQAEADEILPYSQFEKEVQGTSRKAPAYGEVLAHFLVSRKVKSALVPASFPLGFTRELEANKIRVEPAGELYWPERETKTPAEQRLLRKAMEITEAGHGARHGSAEKIEARPRRETGMVGRSFNLRKASGGNRFRDFARGWFAGEHDRRGRRAGV